MPQPATPSEERDASSKESQEALELERKGIGLLRKALEESDTFAGMEVRMVGFGAKVDLAIRPKNGLRCADPALGGLKPFPERSWLGIQLKCHKYREPKSSRKRDKCPTQVENHSTRKDEGILVLSMPLKITEDSESFPFAELLLEGDSVHKRIKIRVPPEQLAPKLEELYYEALELGDAAPFPLKTFDELEIPQSPENKSERIGVLRWESFRCKRVPGPPIKSRLADGTHSPFDEVWDVESKRHGIREVKVQHKVSQWQPSSQNGAAFGSAYVPGLSTPEAKYLPTDFDFLAIAPPLWPTRDDDNKELPLPKNLVFSCRGMEFPASCSVTAKGDERSEVGDNELETKRDSEEL
uniref:Uncharacterized protein n=1 Tax=Chromera velia CCMP2878 TaxID=1169474 RepID=A0A0G4G2H1_9ALVE|eukprot:Cvel_19972.t1-p1 / transcript=Cvel_19972.t1 / gene=Cvel_19972 / organism=Chromera_velia_CCMP2878 / gene_product=hypothetical protein / transcript_product=hypothetical protein / location=Cvel_scaffold1758:36163-39002(+) / protein_length=353 / sequence_SO=supercontig / SO=protein_coding / is_pseudo=false